MGISRKGFLKALGFGILASQAPPGLSAAVQKLERGGGGKLRIRDVEIYAFDVPLKAPFRISLGVHSETKNVLVRVVTDSGLVGLGEACPFLPITGDTQDTILLMARSIREMIKGRDPLAIDSLLGEIGHIVYSNPSIVAAFDMAFFDILGKAAGIPVFRLLGGDKATFETDITTGIDTPEKMAASAGERASRGYKSIKMKVGLDPDEDAARVQAVREAIGKTVRLRIDANQGWTVPQAITALRKMERFDVQFAEQPVVAWDIAGLKAVRTESPIPICADEAVFLPHDALKLVKAEACDYFNIKLMKAGGMTNSMRIAHIADAANIQCMVGCMLETRLALTAAAHVVASQRNIVFADLDSHGDLSIDPVVGGMTVTPSGELTVPEAPGLGVDVDPAFLKKLKKA